VVFNLWPEPMAVNKRKHPRVRARGVAANLRAQEVLKTGCVVENISAGGLLVRTDQALEAGTPVVMDLVRPGMRKLLKLSGRVVGRAEKGTGTPAQMPGLRVQFDPMPDETTERLLQLLRDLGLTPEPPAAPLPVTATPPSVVVAALPLVSPDAPFGPPRVPVDLQQITWAQPEVSTPAWTQPEGLEETRAMSAEAVRTALEAAELTPPGGKVPPSVNEEAQAALQPPPIMPVPAVSRKTPPPAPRKTPLPQPAPEGPEAPTQDSRLMVQIRGLLMELGEVQNRLDAKERRTEDLALEVERLRKENQELRDRLAHAEELLRLQGIKDPGNRF